MHEHELDLIAEHAQGLLTGEPAETARSLVDSCDDCRLEFESQREIRSVLESLPAPTLSGVERHRLRKAVLAEFEEPAVATTAPVIEIAARRRWLAVASVAASVLVFVGLAGVLSGITGDNDESTFDVAAEQPTEEAGAAETTVPANSAMLRVPSTAAPATELAGDAAEQAPAAAEPEGGIRLEEGDDGASFVIDLGPVAFDTLVTVVDESLARATELAPPSMGASYFNDRERPVPSCWNAVTGSVAGVLTAQVEATSIEVYLIADDGSGIEGSAETGYRAEAFDTADCAEYPLD